MYLRVFLREEVFKHHLTPLLPRGGETGSFRPPSWESSPTPPCYPPPFSSLVWPQVCSDACQRVQVKCPLSSIAPVSHNKVNDCQDSNSNTGTCHCFCLRSSFSKTQHRAEWSSSPGGHVFSCANFLTFRQRDGDFILPHRVWLTHLKVFFS